MLDSRLEVNTYTAGKVLPRTNSKIMAMMASRPPLKIVAPTVAAPLPAKPLHSRIENMIGQ
jgi:hypothetical protein